MQNKEVVSELRKLVKPYIGIMSPSHFSQMCTKIENDMCKPKTVDRFFNQFSYFGKWNEYDISIQRLVLSNGKEEYILLHKKDYWDSFKK